MELRWLEDPEDFSRKLQYRVRSDNGIYGPGFHEIDTGWMDIPVVIDLPTLVDNGEENELPEKCRLRLKAEGKQYPRSGCAVCKTSGLYGCPYA